MNATTANTDFIGPAIVVNSPGSAAFSDYEMRLRLGTTDNDGIGVLARVQDDNNFYRITFTNENTGTTGARAPRGMSVQKVRNGVWTELYRDDLAPLFVYTPGGVGLTPTTGLLMFDLTVRAVGDSLAIEVVDAFGNVIAYPLITDTADPLLTGTVGLHTWGDGQCLLHQLWRLGRPAADRHPRAIHRRARSHRMHRHGRAPTPACFGLIEPSCERLPRVDFAFG